MIEETYEYSKAKARKRHIREVATAIPAVLLIGFLAALYVKNPVAHQVAETMVEHWNWVAAGALVLAVFGSFARARH